MRHLFILNPAAGKKESTALLEEQIARLSFPHQVRYTEQPGDARRFVEQEARGDEPLRVYACGGDGTLNEVVNGAAGYDHVAITCVPKGTGNDFLKIFGPSYRDLFYDLEALARGPQTPFDLMDCNGLLGINTTCVGVDARVGAGVHRYKRLPLISGKGAYILSVVETLLRQGLGQPTTLDIGGDHFEGNTTLLCVCNGRCYGGGFTPVPDAMPDNGTLDILHIPRMPLFSIARLLGEYAKGRAKDYPQYVRDFRDTGLTITSPQELVAAVDGEELRSHSFTIRLSEKKVNFFYPAGASYQPQTAEFVSTRRSEL